MSIEKIDVKAIALEDFNAVLTAEVLEAIDSTPTDRVPKSLERLFGTVIMDAINLPSFPYHKSVSGKNGETEVINQNPRDNARRYVAEAFSVAVGDDDSRGGVIDTRDRSEQIVD